jgi:hypothetical protein
LTPTSIITKSQVDKQAKKIDKSVADLYALENIVANGNISAEQIIKRLQKVQANLIATNNLRDNWWSEEM